MRGRSPRGMSRPVHDGKATVKAGAGAGDIDAVVTVDGNDLAGTVTVDVGGSIVTGGTVPLFTVRFSRPFARPPRVLVVEANHSALGLFESYGVNTWHFDQADVSADGFIVKWTSSSSIDGGNSPYKWNYIVSGGE